MTLDHQEYTAVVASTPLSVQPTGYLTLDDSWAPYVQGRLTVTTPTDPTILDPRDLPEITVTLRQRFGDGLQFTSDLTDLFAGGTTAAITTAWAGLLTSALTNLIGEWNGSRIAATSLVATLYITEATHRSDGTTDLTVAGGEHRPQQLRSALRLAPSVPLSAPAEWAVTTIRDLFPYMSPGTLAPGDVDAIVPPASMAALFGAPPAVPSQDQWAPLQAFATLNDLRLWCHPDGIFRLTPRWEAVPGTVNLDNPISASEKISRLDDTWADGVIAAYLPDPDYPDRGRYISSSGAATKVAYVELDIITPYDGVTDVPNVANTIRDRMDSRGRTLEVTHVARFNTAPNMAITIDQPALGWLPASTGVVDAVTFDLDTKRMRVTIRELQEA